MPDQISFMPASQNSFLAALPETTDNQTITGFDSFIPNQVCTPSFLGCRLCIGSNVVAGFLTVTIQASTPFGGVSKSFKITNNISFAWKPFGKFKVEIKITNFRKIGTRFSFSLAANFCIDIPILGWKCKSFNHNFLIPTVLPQAHQSFLSANGDDDGDDYDKNNSYTTMLLLNAMIEEKNGCNCD